MTCVRKAAIPFTTILAVLALAGLFEGFSLIAEVQGESNGTVGQFKLNPEQQRQLDLAIEKRDRSLLPECTEEYFAWRAAAKANGSASAHPLNLGFWSKPGCKGIPDREIKGPRSTPAEKFVSP